ncbi:hypothetical protein CBF63_02795 [Lactobacillus johnsonii]|uniref:Uncharacterized protein n=1 Tax=Lactobacillus johnsonii TaxID=33959 RepID=A0A9X6RWF4_LACJH|nr:hypothetical protein CBF54_08545 [Lactobacillus johnsonii]OYS07120.1 hypothetical protein CBF65_08110 [Lactobacillus johnsonii]OYS07682.1 hypothetical protein CBF62_04680 [Lactobacillus johnsonii]OYS10325.1 hypothetical protein CBF63_02795 [Lactobacillus johnsonii]OYS11479.1 hypothetical protein CBF48_08590 [Lactobacillus johnsonii]
MILWSGFFAYNKFSIILTMFSYYNFTYKMLYLTCNKLGILKFNALKKHYLIVTKGNAFLSLSATF